MVSLDSVETERSFQRLQLYSAELSRVLGGGLVKGSVVLFAGEPGIGKSTLLLQLASSIGKDVGRVVYISGEENAQQIALRGKRLALPLSEIFVMNSPETETTIDAILDMTPLPALVIVDSIQTMRTLESSNSVGSVPQIRSSTAQMVELAKASGIAVLLVGHVTKSGEVRRSTCRSRTKTSIAL